MKEMTENRLSFPHISPPGYSGRPGLSPSSKKGIVSFLQSSEFVCSVFAARQNCGPAYGRKERTDSRISKTCSPPENLSIRFPLVFAKQNGRPDIGRSKGNPCSPAAILGIRLLGFCRQAKLRPCLWPQRANRFVHLENPFPYCNLQHKISPGFCEAK